MPEPATPYNRARLSLEIAGAPCTVLWLEGFEALNHPHRFELELLLPGGADITALLGQSARLTLTGQDGRARTLPGLIAFIEATGRHSDGRIRARAELLSHLHRLRLQRDWRVILRRRVPEILADTLYRHGFSESQVEFRLARDYPVRAHTVQAGERDLDFLRRLAAREGLLIWSETDEDGAERLVIADSNTACRYLEAPLVTCTPQSGQVPESAPPGLYRLSEHHRLLSERILVHDHPEQLAGEPVLARADRRHPLPGHGRQHFHGLGSPGIEAAGRQARHLAEHLDAQRSYLTAHGTRIDLAPGRLFTLDSGPFRIDSGDVLVTAVRHSAGEGAAWGLDDSDCAYTAEVRLIRRDTPWRPAWPAKPDIPFSFAARIESDGPYARLDEQGRYRVRPAWDEGGTAHAEASPPLRRMQPLAGQADDGGPAGFHFPLTDGEEVLMSCLDGDPDRPILLGATPTAERPGPVTARNKTRNVLATAGGNALTLDDELEREAITLTTWGGANILRLDMQAMANRIRLASSQGHLELFARSLMKIQAGENLEERIGADRTQVVEGASRTETQSGEIHHQANTDLTARAAKRLDLTAGENAELIAGKRLVIEAKNNAKITVRGPRASFTVQGGNLTFQGAKDIRIAGKGGGDITFEQSGAGVRIDTAGNVHLWGKNIQLGGDGGVSFGGPVNWNIGSPSMPGEAGVAAPLEPAAIDPLTPPEPPPPPDNVPWVGIELCDALGRPVRGIDYQLSQGPDHCRGTLSETGRAREILPRAEPVHVELHPGVDEAALEQEIRTARRELAQVLDGLYERAAREAEQARARLAQAGPAGRAFIYYRAFLSGSRDGVLDAVPELPPELEAALGALWDALLDADLAAFEGAIARLEAAGAQLVAQTVEALRQILYDAPSRQLLADFVERYAADCVTLEDFAYGLGYARGAAAVTVVLLLLALLTEGAGLPAAVSSIGGRLTVGLSRLLGPLRRLGQALRTARQKRLSGRQSLQQDHRLEEPPPEGRVRPGRKARPTALPRLELPCFDAADSLGRKGMRPDSPGGRAYIRHYQRQLAQQQEAINRMTPIEYLAAREAYLKQGRNPLAAEAQSKTRKRFQDDVTKSIKKSLVNSGKFDFDQADAEAARRAEALMKKLAALHEPDQVAGGWLIPEPRRMGRADVNSSIGSRWTQGSPSRVERMDAAARKAVNTGRGDEPMNVSLRLCGARDRKAGRRKPS